MALRAIKQFETKTTLNQNDKRRMFSFKKTVLCVNKKNNTVEPVNHIKLNQPAWVPMALWVASINRSDPYITAVRYFGIMAEGLLHSRPRQTNFWIAIQEDLRRRVLNVGRDNLLVRYKHVFPREYLKHSYINEALYIAFCYKDLRFLAEYLKNVFKDVNFFKHRFLIYFLRAVFNDFSVAQAHLGKTRGLFIKFKGKISQAGNSRKRRFLVGCGQVSTSQAATYEVEKFQIKTFTGAIGCTIILSSE